MKIDEGRSHDAEVDRALAGLGVDRHSGAGMLGAKARQVFVEASAMSRWGRFVDRVWTRSGEPVLFALGSGASLVWLLMVLSPGA
jgi:hypothetical protein